MLKEVDRAAEYMEAVWADGALNLGLAGTQTALKATRGVDMPRA